MPTPVDRTEVAALVAEGAQLVEVLPEEEFSEEHLPEAMHVPLQQIDSEVSQRLDAGRPVIVYCWDDL